MRHSKRLATLEQQAGAAAQSDVGGWVCVALPGDAPDTFTMRRLDGTAHTVTRAQLAEIAQANATDGGPGVIILDQ
jgi:hypothetical protein